MAGTSRNRPARVLTIFFLGVAIIYGLVALAGDWQPRLGLDLQGGTRITLTAQGDVSADRLDEARKIIEDRVNGSGVAEAKVTTQGNSFVVVEIPGENRPDLEETVKRQAQMRFRVVAQSAVGTSTQATTAPTDGATDGATEAPTEPQVTIAPTPTESGQKKKGKKGEQKTDNGGGGGAGVSSADETESPSPSADPSESPSETPSEEATEAPAGGDEPAITDPIAWAQSPDAESLAAFEAFSCPTDGTAPDVVDDPDKPLVTCDLNGIKYLLSVAMIEGTDLDDAQVAAPDQQSVEYRVNLSFDSEGTETFTEISEALYGTDQQFAIVLDGVVISAPTMNGLITNGQAEISGNFSQTEATSLATSLQFGALPITFGEAQVEAVGPSLAGEQLSAAINAGIAGLVLVMIYCMIYYRGLGIVVLASLVVAAVITYAMVLLLSSTAGFALTLPGIAGLIVAVGITADSFIVYFERIRDEMRDGKSMRVAVESGWSRARNTCLAADTVSLLAAVVLYIFAAGVVKGFAFALGLSTIIDLVVFFWFTHPMVSLLARYRFFNSGHRFSGLSPETLGIDRPAGEPVLVGGKA